MNEQRKLNLTRRHHSADLPFIGIEKPLSQSESKRLPQLLPVLDYILRSSRFSAKQIENSVIKVSRDSIDRTLKKLKEKNLIELKETKAKGEKFYKIKSKPKLRKYRDTLFKWQLTKIIFKNKIQKEATKLKKTFRRNQKRTTFSSRLLSEKDEKKPLKFVSKIKQKEITKIPHPEPVIIYDMPFKEAIKLVMSYHNGQLCDICFKENWISFLKRIDYEQVCELGHVEPLQSTDEFLEHSVPMKRKKSKSITDSELKHQTLEFLKIRRKRK